MTQDQALNILKTGANVFLTGEPGAGKTHTINSFVEYLRACEIEPAITASTGIAATHIGGMTIHSWSGIGIKSHLDKYELDKLASSEYISKRINKAKVLIIDEISMLTANMVDMIDMVCREVRQNSEPFGGIQIIFVGDFFQLPPIVKRETDPKKQKALLEGEDYVKNNTFAYEGDAWARAKPVVCYLSEQHRQDDDTFLSLLSAIRGDDVDEQHFEYITSRQIDRASMPENVTKLYSHNVDVDKVNTSELAKIGDQGKFFAMTSSGSEAVVASIKKGCLSPENLELKVGAVVMCTKNNPKEGYMNGTLGKVIDFQDITGYPLIRTMGGKNIAVTPMDWIVEENGKIRAQITQVPLRLAWAITVHKSQGMSLDAAIMDLSNVFEYGQGYVALSRVRRLSGLYLLGINAQALRVHPDVIEKDIEFKNNSREAEEIFGGLSGDELKKMQENFVIASGGKIKKGKNKKNKKVATGKLEEIREKHQNAYRKWTAKEEDEIASYFKSGKTIKDIATISGRQIGGIRSRLVKLGLIKE